MTESESGKPRPSASSEPKNSPRLPPLGDSSASTAFSILWVRSLQGLVNRLHILTAESRLEREGGMVHETTMINPAAMAIVVVKSRLLSGERKTRLSRHDFWFCRKFKRPSRSNAIKAKKASIHTRP